MRLSQLERHRQGCRTTAGANTLAVPHLANCAAESIERRGPYPDFAAVTLKLSCHVKLTFPPAPICSIRSSSAVALRSNARSASASSGSDLSGHAVHLRLHCLQEAGPEAVVVQPLREALQHSGPEPECAAAQVAAALSVAILLFIVFCSLQQLADVVKLSAMPPINLDACTSDAITGVRGALLQLYLTFETAVANSGQNCKYWQRLQVTGTRSASEG